MNWSDDEQSMLLYFEELLSPQRTDALQQLLDRSLAAPGGSADPGSSANPSVGAGAAALASCAGEAQHNPGDTSSPAEAWQPLPTEDRFEVLVFEVKGMRFAIPLIALGGIHQLGEVARLPGKPEWFAGVVSQGGKRYQLVDTGRWVMQSCPDAEPYAYFVVLGNTPWALAVSRLQGTQTLHRNDVRWRTQPGSQSWSAGTVKSRMCVLLYSRYLAQWLDQGRSVNAAGKPSRPSLRADGSGQVDGL